MVDTRGYICPTPVLMVQKALKDRPAMVEVLAEAGAAVENMNLMLGLEETAGLNL